MCISFASTENSKNIYEEEGIVPEKKMQMVNQALCCGRVCAEHGMERKDEKLVPPANEDTL
jgi:hypothetical protein